MEKFFVPYDIALDLYKLGFDEKCLKYWNDYGKDSDNRYQLSFFMDEWSHDVIYAPLKAQAFEWFREKHGIWCEITSQIGLKHHSAQILPQGGWFCKNLSSYEEVELACLNKLIEICKNKE